MTAQAAFWRPSTCPPTPAGCPDYGDAEFCPFTLGAGRVSPESPGRFSFRALAADFDDITFTAAPEPSTWAMVLIGFAGLGDVALRRKRKSFTAGITPKMVNGVGWL